MTLYIKCTQSMPNWHLYLACNVVIMINTHITSNTKGESNKNWLRDFLCFISLLDRIKTLKFLSLPYKTLLAERMIICVKYCCVRQFINHFLDTDIKKKVIGPQQSVNCFFGQVTIISRIFLLLFLVSNHKSLRYSN